MAIPRTTRFCTACPCQARSEGRLRRRDGRAARLTITNLINRFYDIADGKIRYDGINVNKIRKADLRRSLGVVLQDVNLFTGTVMDNIRYGSLEATDEECIHAAELAGADDFIRRLPEGYDTMLTGNGSQLSQGQRQLISIARAAVADPPAMILDEATELHRHAHRGHRAARYGRAHAGPHDTS
ncbi:MAG: ATP-binding cassette domain-containing protein [Collinsella sp.]